MKKCTKLLLYLALILGVVQAENTFSLYQNLPERTIAVFHHTNIPGSLEAFQKTSLCQIYYEQEFQEFLKSFRETIESEMNREIKQIEQQIGLSAEEILGIFQGDLTIALVDLHLDESFPGAAISFDFGESGTVVRRLIELAQQGMGIQFKTISHNGVDIMTVSEAPMETEISYAVIGNTLLLTSRLDLMQELVSGEGAKLVNRTNFVSAVTQVQPEAVTPGKLLFLNTEQLIQEYKPAIPEDVSAIVEKLGGFDITSIAMAGNTDGAAINWNMFLGCNTEKGVLSLFDFGEASLSSLENVPQNSMVVSMAHMDYDLLMSKIERILIDVDPSEGLLEEYKKGEEQLAQMLGFSLRNDFVKSLGSQVHSFSYLPAEGGLLPKSISVMNLRDRDLFMDIVRKSCEKMQLDIKEMYVEGVTVNYFSTPLGNFGEDPFSNVDNELEAIATSLNIGLSGLAFFIENNDLYIGASMADIKHYLINRQQWGSINYNQDFLNAKAFLPEGCSWFVYTDWRGIFNGLWNTVVPFLRSGDGLIRGLGVPFDSALLPRAKTISKHLTPGIVYYKASKNGILLSAYGTMEFTIPLLGASVIGITAAIAIPEIMRAKIDKNETATIANLRAMVVSQSLFQNSCILDRNSNGIGEYGFLQELAGLVNVRGTDMPLTPPFLSSNMSFYNGLAEQNGYYYYCYLPGKNEAMGEALIEDDNVMPGNADNQEVDFVIYAWPIKQDQTGSRAFAVNSSGEIHNTYYHYYNGREVPLPNAAYEEGGDIGSGSFARDNYAVDGNYWSPVYDY